MAKRTTTQTIQNMTDVRDALRDQQNHLDMGTCGHGNIRQTCSSCDDSPEFNVSSHIGVAIDAINREIENAYRNNQLS